MVWAIAVPVPHQPSDAHSQLQRTVNRWPLPTSSCAHRVRRRAAKTGSGKDQVGQASFALRPRAERSCAVRPSPPSPHLRVYAALADGRGAVLPPAAALHPGTLALLGDVTVGVASPQWWLALSGLGRAGRSPAGSRTIARSRWVEANRASWGRCSLPSRATLWLPANRPPGSPHRLASCWGSAGARCPPPRAGRDRGGFLDPARAPWPGDRGLYLPLSGVATASRPSGAGARSLLPARRPLRAGLGLAAFGAVPGRAGGGARLSGTHSGPHGKP